MTCVVNPALPQILCARLIFCLKKLGTIQFVGVAVGVGLGVEVAVAVGVGVNVGVAVAVAVGVTVAVAVAVAVGVGVNVAVGVGVNVAVAVGVGVGVGEPDAACKSKTQSGSPALLFPGVVKLWLPLLGNGEPEMFVNVLAVGSYQRAVTGPAQLLIAMASVWETGV